MTSKRADFFFILLVSASKNTLFLIFCESTDRVDVHLKKKKKNIVNVNHTLYGTFQVLATGCE